MELQTQLTLKVNGSSSKVEVSVRTTLDVDLATAAIAPSISNGDRGLGARPNSKRKRLKCFEETNSSTDIEIGRKLSLFHYKKF